MSNIHDSRDNRNVAIKNVGICDYRIPFTLNNGGEKFITFCKIKSGVSLNSNIKGAHLSRIVMTIDKFIVNKEITITDLTKLVFKLEEEVGVDNSNLLIEFPISYKNITPKSEIDTYLTSNIKLYFKSLNKKIAKSYIIIDSNGAMLCPNSKAKSKYGAHSQKCNISLKLDGDITNINIVEYCELLNKSCSAPVFGVVRSVDESYMTELAYDNPKFSEDAIRDLITFAKEKFTDGNVSANLVNYESIHQHNVFCEG